MILVTGGAGFLGSHLCRHLLDRGDEVICVDNLITGSIANVEANFGRRGFTFLEHDVSTYLWIPGDVDAVLHFASPASTIFHSSSVARFSSLFPNFASLVARKYAWLRGNM